MPIALDIPAVPPMWTPSVPWWMRPRPRKCPKCGKRKRGFFESLRDPMNMAVNGCCCGGSPPCTACSGTQPNVTASGTGTSPPCGDDGSYPILAFTSPSGACTWVWQTTTGGADGMGNRITVQYVTTTSIYNVFSVAPVRFSGIGATQYGFDTGSLAGSALPCVGGKLTGTVSLPGVNLGYPCTGNSIILVFG